MDRLLYTTAIGASHIERAQAVHANNLANVSTAGFRADFATAQARWAGGEGFPVRTYGITQQPGVDFRPGVLEQTGQELDIAIRGDGFIAVELPGGAEGYTRAGNFTVDALGQLLSGDGHRVLGDAGPTAMPPYTRLYIGGDGSITVQPEGLGPETQVQVGRVKLVDPEIGSLRKDATGMLTRIDGAEEPAAAEVEVVSGFVEGSNVSAVGEMTEILALARQFEIEVRMMRTAEENDRAAAQLLQVG